MPLEVIKQGQRILLEHPNKHRVYGCGEVGNISPTYKSHRFPPTREMQELANELRRLILLFKLNRKTCMDLIKEKFGSGCGNQSFHSAFLDPVYGVGFNPRKGTLEKYLYLKNLLAEQEKALAKDPRPTKIRLPKKQRFRAAPLSEEEVQQSFTIEVKHKKKAIIYLTEEQKEFS